MKKITKVSILIISLVLICMSLVSCLDIDKYRDTIKDFTDNIAFGDFEYAKTLMHPDCYTDIEKLTSSFALDNDVDLSKGIEIKRYMGFTSSAYNSDYNGSFFSTTAIIEVNGKEFHLYAEIVDNDNGYGIYDFRLY